MYRIAAADVATAASGVAATPTLLLSFEDADARKRNILATRTYAGPEALAWSPDGKTLYVGEAKNGAVWAYSVGDEDAVHGDSGRIFFDRFDGEGPLLCFTRMARRRRDGSRSRRRRPTLPRGTESRLRARRQCHDPRENPHVAST